MRDDHFQALDEVVGQAPSEHAVYKVRINVHAAGRYTVYHQTKALQSLDTEKLIPCEPLLDGADDLCDHRVSLGCI